MTDNVLDHTKHEENTVDGKGGEHTDPARLIDLVPEYEKIDGWLKLKEAELLFEAAAAVRSGCIVEIGSYRGRSTVALAAGSTAGANAPVYAIEPHEHFIGPKGGAFGPNDRRSFFRTMLQTKLVGTVRLLNSTSQVIVPGWDKPVGLLFIDGDHRYEAVYTDFTGWRPFLTNDSLVIFNDAKGSGTSQLIRELVAEGRLAAASTEGRLAAFHFIAVTTEIEPDSFEHNDIPGVYPELVAGPDAPENTQKIKSVGHHLYYGGNGSYLYQPIQNAAAPA